MKFFITYLILLSAFPTCCYDDPIEIEKVALSESEIQLIPYSINQSINFKHSNGFTFDFFVTEDNYNWKRDSYCDECCGEEYTSYQERVVTLQANYPEFNIVLSLNNLDYFQIQERILNLKVNRYQSPLKYDDRSEFVCENTICHNEIVINNKTYFNVIESTLENRFNDNSNNLHPQKVLYNNDFGIIQIKISNNETYSLNN